MLQQRSRSPYGFSKHSFVPHAQPRSSAASCDVLGPRITNMAAEGITLPVAVLACLGLPRDLVIRIYSNVMKDK